MDNNNEKTQDDLLKEQMEKLGINSPDPDSYQYSIGNTQRSDFEFYKQIKEAEERKEMLDKASGAEGLADALDATLSAYKTKEPTQDPVMDYIDSKTPSQDYTEAYPPPDNPDLMPKYVEADKPEDIAQDFAENEQDITEPQAEVQQEPVENSFAENEQDIIEPPADPVRDTFQDNTGSVTDTTDTTNNDDFKQ